MNPSKKTIFSCLFYISIALSSGCASVGTETAYREDAADPWQGMNRKVFAFNDAVDSVTLEPLAKGYRELPSFLRHRISHFFANLGDIPNAANNFLQGKLGDAANDLLRLVVNTTFGVLGMFDVASNMGLEKHDEDFGQTLAQWGVGSGPYLVVPIIGPSTARDFPGAVVDYFMHPINYVNDVTARNTLRVVDAVDTRSDFVAKEKIVRELSPDFYSAVKSFYLDRRKAQIKDGVDTDDIEDLYDEISELRQ